MMPAADNMSEEHNDARGFSVRKRILCWIFPPVFLSGLGIFLFWPLVDFMDGLAVFYAQSPNTVEKAKFWLGMKEISFEIATLLKDIYAGLLLAVGVIFIVRLIAQLASKSDGDGATRKTKITLATAVGSFYLVFGMLILFLLNLERLFA